MAEKKKIELIKLTIQIGDSKVQVTKDEARDLYRALAEMFEPKKETVYVDRYRDRPWYWPYYGSGTSLNAQQAEKFAALQSLADTKPTLTYNAGSVTLSASDYKYDPEAA